MKRMFLVSAGFISIGLGIIGVFVPLLPTTAFMLLAAWLFSKSSPHWRLWLLNHRWFGKHIRNYTEHRGITRMVRVRSLFVLWLTLAVSAVLTGGPWYVWIILLMVGIGVTWHLCALNTVAERSSPENSEKHSDSDSGRQKVA